jgi:DNA polymerase III delta prime subunit
MVRFRLKDEDDAAYISPPNMPHPSQTAIVKHSNSFQEDKNPVTPTSPIIPPFPSLGTSIGQPSNASAFFVAYQPDGTPILVPYHANNTEVRSRSKRAWTFWVVMIAIVVQLIRWYGPPAPPSERMETWREFAIREGGRFAKSAVALMSVIPHVGLWISKEIHAQVNDYFQAERCSMMAVIPQNIQSKLQFHIVGQSRAIDIVMQCLHAWKQHEKALILLFAGTLGVGKMELAQELANQLLCPDASLRIKGREYSQRADLVPQIRHHISRGFGHVVIIQHPEDMTALLLSQVLEALASIPNLIIIVCTHIGSRIIHRHIKDEISVFHSSSKLDLALRREFDIELGPGVSEYVTGVAPFIPLTPEDISQIFIDKAHRLLNITITPELAQHWTGPNFVEYLDWSSKGRHIGTISTRGAKMLEEGIWHQLLLHVNNCIDSSTRKTSEKVVADFEQSDIIISKCNGDNCNNVCRFQLNS